MITYKQIVVLALALIFILSECAFVASDKYVVLPSGKKIAVEIADTNAKRARGLMFRKSLDYNRGMLFIFEEEDFHAFWMKNCFIALDLIWIGESKKIVYFEENAVPCKAEPCTHYLPMQKAKYVLEVNSGFAKKEKLKLGDQLSFDP